MAAAKLSACATAPNIILLVVTLGHFECEAIRFAARAAGARAAGFPAAKPPVKVYPAWASSFLFDAGTGQRQLQLGQHGLAGFIASLNQFFARGKVGA